MVRTAETRRNNKRARREIASPAPLRRQPKEQRAVALWPVLGTHYGGLPIRMATLVTLGCLVVAFVVFERSLVTSYAWLSRPLTPLRVMAYSPTVGRRARSIRMIARGVE